MEVCPKDKQKISRINYIKNTASLYHIKHKLNRCVNKVMIYVFLGNGSGGNPLFSNKGFPPEKISKDFQTFWFITSI